MINLTKAAEDKIKEIIIADKIGDAQAVRFKIVGSGCAGFSHDMYFDTPLDDDLRFDYNGISAVIDPMSAMYLDGMNVDFVETLQGSGFKFFGGQITSSCGCGKSFAV